MTKRDLGITFAGGGNRAFYQMGLMNRWRAKVLPRTGCMATCSAGACVATLLLSGREVEVGEYWREQCRTVKRNIEWCRILSGRRPTPHESLMRGMLLYALSCGGFERLRSQPFPVMVLTTAFPRALPGFGAALLGWFVYELEKKLHREVVHPSYGRRIGFKGLIFDARQCASAEVLVNLIIASSATPPFTAMGKFGGQRLIDGGVIDNVPAFLADDVPGIKNNLVMLTRPYPKSVVGRQGSRLYVAPSTPLPVSQWDFTRLDLLEETIARGELDAEKHDGLLDDLLD